MHDENCIPDCAVDAISEEWLFYGAKSLDTILVLLAPKQTTLAFLQAIPTEIHDSKALPTPELPLQLLFAHERNVCWRLSQVHHRTLGQVLSSLENSLHMTHLRDPQILEEVDKHKRTQNEAFPELTPSGAQLTYCKTFLFFFTFYLLHLILFDSFGFLSCGIKHFYCTIHVINQLNFSLTQVFSKHFILVSLLQTYYGNNRKLCIITSNQS